MRKFKFNPKFGELSITPVPGSQTQSYLIEKDRNGNEVSRKVFNSHLVCCGVNYCSVCGKLMGNQKDK